MRLKIVQTGEPVLREQGRLLTPEEIRSEEIQRLIQEMRDAMREAPGVGLAAPQIGLPLQLAVIEDREDLLKSFSAEDLTEHVQPFAGRAQIGSQRARRRRTQRVVAPPNGHAADARAAGNRGCEPGPDMVAGQPVRRF